MTLVPATPPAPLVTPQYWVGLDAWLLTVTSYFDRSATGVGKTKPPGALTVRSSAPLSCSTRPLPFSPVTVPPTVKELVEQVMSMEVTSAPPTVPPPPLTEQTCAGPLGWV